MFTGIIEAFGVVREVRPNNGNITLAVEAPFLKELKIDQSVAHNGVCLTVDGIFDDHYTVTIIQESLNRSNLGSIQPGDEVNLERCLKVGERLDGHIVQGHVDCVAHLVDIIEYEGSSEFFFTYDDARYITVEKGSVCVNGVSLTVVKSEPRRFSVALIPYTLEHTNFKNFGIGEPVNIEFDIVGKYILKSQE